MALIEIRGVRKVYPMPGGDVEALRGVDLSFEPGEMAAIVGASGSGKSTLLYLMGLMIDPTSGEYRLDGEAVGSLPDAERSRIRARRIGFVFQSFHLVPQLTVLENVLLAGRYGGGRKDLPGRARALLDRVGLSHRLGHRPRQLSSGEMQRTAIARALLLDPPLVLADEPTGNLDEKNGEEITRLLEELHAEGKTVILVTHNPALASRARRVLTMRDGQLAA